MKTTTKKLRNNSARNCSQMRPGIISYLFRTPLRNNSVWFIECYQIVRNYFVFFVFFVFFRRVPQTIYDPLPAPPLRLDGLALDSPPLDQSAQAPTQSRSVMVERPADLRRTLRPRPKGGQYTICQWIRSPPLVEYVSCRLLAVLPYCQRSFDMA